MNASIEDLRTALHEAANDAARPHALDTVALVQRRVTQRRRRAGATAMIALLALGLGAAAIRSGQRSLTPADTQAPDGTSSVTHDPHLIEPGATTLSITQWQMSPDTSIKLAYPLHRPARVFLEAYCEHTADTVPDLVIQDGTATSDLTCAGRDWPGAKQRIWLAGPVDPGQGQGRVTVTAQGANGIGVARIAILQQQPAAAGGPNPPRPSHPGTAPSTAWSLHPNRNLFAPRPGQYNTPITISGHLQTDLGVILLVRGPGTLKATANGHPISFLCVQDPDNILGCRAGGLLGWQVTASSYGTPAQVLFPLEDLPGIRPEGPITLTVTPSGFAGDDWRVATTVTTGFGTTNETWSRK